MSGGSDTKEKVIFFPSEENAVHAGSSLCGTIARG